MAGQAGFRGRMAARAMFLGCLALGAIGAAGAQEAWTFSGSSFPAREGWCSKQTVQDATPAMEVRPCGKDFPYMSLAVGGQDDGRVGLQIANLLSSGAEYAAGAEGKAQVQKLVSTAGSSCTISAYEVKTDPFPGVRGFTAEASYTCNGSSAVAGTFRNFTTFARSARGEIWLVSFDYPNDPITSGDIAMLQSALFTIQNR